MTSSVVREPVRALAARRDDLSAARVESRMSAYIYGDVLVLAATAGVTVETVRSGAALLVVLGTVISTYVAHVLADIVGAVFAGHASAALVRTEARDSMPVLSAGAPALAFLAAGALDVLPPLLAQALACATIILRLGGIGLVYRRLQHETTVRRAIWFGVVVAVVVTAAAALKLWLTH